MISEKLQTGDRVRATCAIRYRGAVVCREGDEGQVVHAIGDVPYVRWDATRETFPAGARQLARVR